MVQLFPCITTAYILDTSKIHKNRKEEQEMSNDTYAPLTLTFDLMTPKSIRVIY